MAGLRILIPRKVGVEGRYLTFDLPTGQFQFLVDDSIKTIVSDEGDISTVGLIKATSGASFPSGPVAGDLFWRTDEDKLYVYNGSTWIEVGVGVRIDEYYVLTKSSGTLTNDKVHPNTGTPNYNIQHEFSDLVSKSHTLLDDIGTNTHAQVDIHIADTANPHTTTVANLNDSDISSPIDGQTLRWDSSTNTWVNSVLGSSLSWQQSVLDKDLTAPPGSPSSGDRYIIALSPTGAWSGHEDDITEWDGAQWNFTEHIPGMAAWVEDENDIYVCIGDHVVGVRCWDKLEITINHAALENLTYASSGHTGFEPTVIKGNLTEDTSSVLTIGSGTGAVIGSGTTIQVALADATTSGYLSSANWNAFNNKTTESTTVSDTNTVDLTLTTYDITADVSYQNTSTIDLSDDASGFKADLNSTLKSNYDTAYTHTSLTNNPHTVTYTQAGAIQDTTDVIKDTHIDWGTGANQVSADDVPDGIINAIITLVQEANFTIAYDNRVDTWTVPLSFSANTASLLYAAPLSLDGSNKLYVAADAIKDTHIDWGAGTNQVDCSDVPIKLLGSPTYSNICQQTDTTASVGKTSGGGITDNGNQTLTVAAGTGFIKTTDSEIGTLVSFDWVENAAVSYTVDSINYVIVQYNGGTPLVTSTTDFNSINFHDEFVIGYVYGKSATVADILLAGNNLPNAKVKDCIRLFYRGPERMVGGTIGETGVRQVTCTAGLFYLGDCKIDTAQFDSSTTNFEHYYYRNSSTTWAEVATTGTIDNTQYNPLTGGSAYSLQTLTANRYGVHWVYLCFSGEMNVIIGNGNYTLALANAAEPPATIPDYLDKFAILVGKIIIQKGDSSFTSIESAFVTPFTPSAVNNHNDLSNIQGGTTDEYYHLTLTQHGNVGTMPAPNYDSGWTAITAGSMYTFTHSLGGDVDKYMVVVDAKADAYKINQINFGTRQLAGGVAGYRWEDLDNSEIKVWRLPQDVAAEEVRVRIWVHV